ncbi:sulfurtransferase [Chelativorans multitrophicus]|uniref:sulfurtransferase n=1 Tax=Chelativorans multitrophicus TaxID=449973 RepID=UPI001408A168|nr:sulfurtransferase [Chelativorans multitrophicus]
MSTNQKAPPVVSAEWLLAHLNDADVQVIDGTTFTPGTGQDAPTAHRERRIPGAIFFDIDRICDPRPGPPKRMLPGPELFASFMGELGLRDDAHLVAYDVHGLYSAARIWWMLRIYGHERISVLDGGLPAWTAAGGATESGEPKRLPPTQWPVRPRGGLVRDWRQILDNIDSRQETVVDVRPAEMFNGDTSAIYPGVRSGHIPGSVNVSQRDLRFENGKFRSIQDMSAIIAAAGVDPDGPMVASCGSGVTACVLSLAMEIIRGEPIPVYDGSWEEWGSRPDLPVEIN